VALIPQVDSPQSLGEFHLISLLYFMYKLFVKVLALWLVSMKENHLVQQSNFSDIVVAINEVVELAKKSKHDCLIFQSGL